MPIIGVAGAIAGGKTTVCKLFEKRGAVIINADFIGKQVVEKDPKLQRKLIETFGGDIIDQRGILERRKLGSIVFQDHVARARLNAIVHPALLSELTAQVNTWLSKNPETVIVIDAALLLDWDLESLLDALIVVKSTRKQRLERLVKYTGLTHEEAEDRILAQSHFDDKENMADYIITNNGHLNELERQAGEIWDKIMDDPKFKSQTTKGTVLNPNNKIQKG